MEFQFVVKTVKKVALDMDVKVNIPPVTVFTMEKSKITKILNPDSKRKADDHGI